MKQCTIWLPWSDSAEKHSHSSSFFHSHWNGWNMENSLSGLISLPWRIMNPRTQFLMVPTTLLRTCERKTELRLNALFFGELTQDFVSLMILQSYDKNSFLFFYFTMGILFLLVQSVCSRINILCSFPRLNSLKIGMQINTICSRCTLVIFTISGKIPQLILRSY